MYPHPRTRTHTCSYRGIGIRAQRLIVMLTLYLHTFVGACGCVANCLQDLPPENAGFAVMAMHKWVKQNTFVEAQSDFTFRIEQTYQHPHLLVEQICEKCALRDRRRRTGDTLAPAGPLQCPSFLETMVVVNAMDKHGKLR